MSDEGRIRPPLPGLPRGERTHLPLASALRRDPPHEDEQDLPRAERIKRKMDRAGVQLDGDIVIPGAEGGDEPPPEVEWVPVDEWPREISQRLYDIQQLGWAIGLLEDGPRSNEYAGGMEFLHQARRGLRAEAMQMIMGLHVPAEQEQPPPE
jgi:hypothetical protein